MERAAALLCGSPFFRRAAVEARIKYPPILSECPASNPAPPIRVHGGQENHAFLIPFF